MPAARVIELEQFYYLSHFKELLGEVEQKHRGLLTPESRKFLDEFRLLSRNAQALYVRIANRKGYLFSFAQLQYQELGQVENTIAELSAGGWVRPLNESDQVAYLRSTTKTRLVETLRTKEPDGDWRASWKKDLLVSYATKFQLSEFADDKALREMVVQGRADELNYLFFLYFGRIETALTKFALRDLGLIRSNKMQASSRAAFDSDVAAKQAYFFATLILQIEEATEVELVEIANQVDQWPAGSDEDLLDQRERALNKLGRRLEQSKNLDVALDIYQQATTYPSTERAVRLLLKRKDLDQADEKLKQLIAQPSSDEELLFAEDLYARTFGEQRRSPMTDWLRAAESIDLDESGRGSVERSVSMSLAKQGAQVFMNRE